MKKYLLPAGAAAACFMLLSYPSQAISAASGAMVLWAQAFAPVLFPFFVITPALCCPEATHLYQRLLGGWMEKLFGCPEKTAGALAISLMAGSPAGAIALGRVKEGMTLSQVSRALLLCSGLSPGFFISFLGEALLKNGGAGRLLLRSHVLSLVLSGLFLRKAFGKQKELCARESSAPFPAHPVNGAVLSMLTVCGWMVCFSVLSQMALILLPLPGWALLPFLEITGGCRQIVSLPLSPPCTLILLSFSCGFGGLSVFMQNSALFPQIKKARLLPGKLLHGLLASLFTALQIHLPSPLPGTLPIGKIGLTFACILPILVYFCVLKGGKGAPPSFAVES